MATATAVRDVKQYIGGDWVGAAGGETYDDRDPFTGDVVATAPASTADDAVQAIEAAAAAFESWSATPPAERQRVFLAAADLLEARRDEVVSMLARETGATFGFGMFQSFFVPNLFRQSAALAYAPVGTVIPADSGAFAMGLRKPVGVVGRARRRRRHDVTGERVAVVVRLAARGTDPVAADVLLHVAHCRCCGHRRPPSREFAASLEMQV